MLRAPDRDAHAVRLRGLLDRFRAEERWLTQMLHDLQTRLDRMHREIVCRRLDGDGEDEAGDLVERLTCLQRDHEDLGTELVHVRLAIAGTDEELSVRRGIPAPARAHVTRVRLGA